MALLPSALGKAEPLGSDLLELQVVEHGVDVRVVTVGGEIDALTAPELDAVVTAQLATVPVVVVDLDRVQFLGSVGLSVLVKANERAVREGRHLRLVCQSRIVNRALDATGLRDQFSFADTVSQAVHNSP